MTHPSHGWSEKAMCRDVGNKAFFSTKPEKQTVAKQLCDSCEVKKECLKYAMRFPDLRGIWGGLTKDERLSLKRRVAEKKRLREIYEEDE